jgi:hypothetical protein
VRCVVLPSVCCGFVIRRDIILHILIEETERCIDGLVEAYVTGIRRASPISNRDPNIRVRKRTVICTRLLHAPLSATNSRDSAGEHSQRISSMILLLSGATSGSLQYLFVLICNSFPLLICISSPLLSFPLLPSPLSAPRPSRVAPSSPSRPAPQPHAQTPRHELLLCDLPPLSSGDALSLCVRQDRGGEAVGALSPEGRCVKLGYACLMFLELGGCQR